MITAKTSSAFGGREAHKLSSSGKTTTESMDMFQVTDYFKNKLGLPPPLKPLLRQNPIRRRPTQQQQPTITTIWVPGYPGSGSELVRTLVHKLTGHVAANVHHNWQGTSECFAPSVITCKTHFPGGGLDPQRVFPLPAHVKFSNRPILLLRNPAHAIPSGLNWKWERDHHRLSHSTKMPQDDWRKVRTQHFDNCLAEWKQLIVYWHTTPPFENVTYIAFERLTDPVVGPQVLKQLAVALVQRQDDANPQLQESDLDHRAATALWTHVVQHTAPNKRATNNATMSVSSYIPNYMLQQKEALLQVLDELIHQFQDAQPELVDILQQYVHDIQSHLLLDMEEDQLAIQ